VNEIFMIVNLSGPRAPAHTNWFRLSFFIPKFSMHQILFPPATERPPTGGRKRVFQADDDHSGLELS
jgi:hypothetical protein